MGFWSIPTSNSAETRVPNAALAADEREIALAFRSLDLLVLRKGDLQFPARLGYVVSSGSVSRVESLPENRHEGTIRAIRNDDFDLIQLVLGPHVAEAKRMFFS